MKTASLAVILAVAAIIGTTGRLANGQPPADRDLQAVNAWVGKVLESAPGEVKPQLHKVAVVKDANLDKVFPDSRFYGIYFVTWPRPAGRLPKELSFAMLVRLQQAESIDPIRDEQALLVFLGHALPEVRDEASAATAVSASLRLAEAAAKAGSYGFGKPDVSVVRQNDGIVATAQAVAQGPARGEVVISLNFGADGKIVPTASKIDDRTNPGPLPPKAHPD